MKNKSHEALDSRSLLRILYEKATFGAVPTHFKINGHEAWHPVQFVENNLLEALTFSDGTTHFVSNEARAFDQSAKDVPLTTYPSSQEKHPEWPGFDDVKQAEPMDSPSDYYRPMAERNDLNVMQDMESALDGKVTEAVTEDYRPVDDPTPGAASVADYASDDPEPTPSTNDPISDSLNSLLRPATSASTADSDTAAIAGKFKPRGFA